LKAGFATSKELLFFWVLSGLAAKSTSGAVTARAKSSFLGLGMAEEGRTERAEV
jgi:hypothetical protein